MHGGLIALTVLIALLTVPFIYLVIVSIINVHKELHPSAMKCHADKNCESWEKCINNACYHICRDVLCGYNEHCISQIHNFTCQCLPGFERGAEGGCRLIVIRPYLAELISAIEAEKSTAKENIEANAQQKPEPKVTNETSVTS